MIPPLMECPYAHRHLYRSCGGRSVESEGRREVPLSVDLRLQIDDLLLREGNGIGAGDKAARRRLLAADLDECSRELGRVAGLLAGRSDMQNTPFCMQNTPVSCEAYLQLSSYRFSKWELRSRLGGG